MEESNASKDTRHEARRLSLSVLFSWNFISQDLEEALQASIEELGVIEFDKDLYKLIVRGVMDNVDLLDSEIKKSKLTLAFENIAKVDLIILRMAILELKIVKTAPLKSIIDEAIELAKEFGGEESYSFVNGVLGTLAS